MVFRRLLPFVIALPLGACQSKQETVAKLPTTAVTRGDIAVRVQATGSVEPINPVEVKSKAGGQINQLPVEVGNVVAAGALLAQVDPRDVNNELQQAIADDVVSSATYQNALKDQRRKDSLFVRHVITAAAHDSTRSSVTSAQSDMISKRAAVDLARQKQEDATVRAPIGGTIVSRPVSNGMVISSATSANGGTTLMTIADLGRVRMRVTIDEVEMANIHVGERATVKVDAFPDHNFDGTIEKIEPQAVVTQGVTFFPVMVSVSNRDGLLMPGMNGEVTIQAADIRDAVQVPIDAVRATNELAPIGRMFAIPVDSIISQLRRDLVPAADGGTTGIPGRYAIVALSDSVYEMRLLKTGPTDLRVVQVLDGLKVGDRVVLLGTIMTTKPPIPPRLQIAENLRRDAPSSAASKASKAAASSAPKPPPPVPAGKTKKP